MFEINSYEPSPEANEFNRDLGLVEDIKTDTKKPVEATKPAVETTKPAATKTTELTPEQKQEKLAALVAIPETTLKTYKLAELRQVAKGLLPRVNSYLKVDLLALLTEIRILELQRLADLTALEKSQQQEQKKALIKASERTPLETRIVGIKTTLKDIAQDTNSETEMLENVWAFAAETVTVFRLNYADSTVKDYLAEVRDSLTDEAKAVTSERYQTALIAFGKSALRMFHKYIVASNDAYKAKVFKYGSNNTRVDGNALIDHAVNILEVTTEKPQRKQALNLAIALVLLTGRRTAEILSSANLEIDPDNEDGVIFTGQLKGKKEDNEKKKKEVFKIPVLTDRTKVIKALSILKASEFHKTDPAEVNNCYATGMKRLMPDWLKVAKIEGKEALTPKSMRAVYANLCADRIYKGNANGRAAYIASIMGHEEDDQITAHSYMVWEVGGSV